ncbi:hypothetical protein CLOSTASPAR_02911 [[Clostridium] asparagiforme DSM 15981]|uniref:Uncharacterized protein n=1 Tax=[Clostridium] asparagiforme DSM 15981 TaxID=518636 RepID=C0D0X4_9FIRM|nr:hypothetical protein CLOSTASPAR_02911 [[Clostridium] asparagiforme DSM 15981]
MLHMGIRTRGEGSISSCPVAGKKPLAQPAVIAPADGGGRYV